MIANKQRHTALTLIRANIRCMIVGINIGFEPMTHGLFRCSTTELINACLKE
jgi:hypothetical protein